MVKANRKQGRIQHNYDIMIGPVANDNTMVTVNRFVQGIYTADEGFLQINLIKKAVRAMIHCKSFHNPASCRTDSTKSAPSPKSII